MDGVQSTTAFVRGVSAFSSWAGESFHPSSSRVSTSTGRRADETNLLRVAHPVRLGDDDLVSRLVESERQVEERVLGADAHADVLVLRTPAPRALRRLADGLLERRNACDGRVLGAAGVDGALGRFAHVLGRLEVGLADAEREDVDALGLELQGLGFIASVMLGATTLNREANVRGTGPV